MFHRRRANSPQPKHAALAPGVGLFPGTLEIVTRRHGGVHGDHGSRDKVDKDIQGTVCIKGGLHELRHIFFGSYVRLAEQGLASLLTYLFSDGLSPVGSTSDKHDLQTLRSKDLCSRFANALSDRSQNSLDAYLLDFYVRSERGAVCRCQGVATLDEETEYVIRQYSYGCLGTTIEWILGKNGLSVESMARYQYLCMPEILKRAWMADASGAKASLAERNHSGQARGKCFSYVGHQVQAPSNAS